MVVWVRRAPACGLSLLSYYRRTGILCELPLIKYTTHIPTIGSMMGVDWHSTLDFDCGYSQMEVHPHDKEKTVTLLKQCCETQDSWCSQVRIATCIWGLQAGSTGANTEYNLLVYLHMSNGQSLQEWQMAVSNHRDPNSAIRRKEDSLVWWPEIVGRGGGVWLKGTLSQTIAPSLRLCVLFPLRITTVLQVMRRGFQGGPPRLISYTRAQKGKLPLWAIVEGFLLLNVFGLS